MSNLSDSTIFLHGPSGSGKGEAERKITKKYLDMGYKVHVVASGDLFREAQANPTIARTMKAGKYFDTLEDILPGLEERYSQFLADYEASGGKAVLILDGFIRRDGFARTDDETGEFIENVPSQIEQIATALLASRNATANFALTDLNEAMAEIVDSQHVLIDVDPRDAESQMLIRANKEIGEIRLQLAAQVQVGSFPFTSTATMVLLIDKLADIANAETRDKDELKQLSAIADEIRAEIAEELNVKSEGSYAKFFGQFGIKTGLRDDDVSPLARKKRIENYVTTVEGAGSTTYAQGFAAEAITSSLGFIFLPDGSFVSTRENCKVVKNGKSRGVELTDFQLECESVSSVLHENSHRSLEGGQRGIEVKGKAKEK